MGFSNSLSPRAPAMEGKLVGDIGWKCSLVVPYLGGGFSSSSPLYVSKLSIILLTSLAAVVVQVGSWTVIPSLSAAVPGHSKRQCTSGFSGSSSQ